ncbi:hypothetical protein EON77_12830, partial [bacterium]
MGLFADLRDAVRRARSEPLEATTPEAAEPLEPEVARRRISPRALARELREEFPDHVPDDELFERAEAAGLDVQDVARALDATREPAGVDVRKVNVSALAVIDLAPLDSVRTRIKGSAFYVTDDERRKYGGPEYLLIREPDNPVDSGAVAVYGRGRKVGHLSTARAASLAPLLDALTGNAYRVTGTGTSS